jgi:galactokinase
MANLYKRERPAERQARLKTALEAAFADAEDAATGDLQFVRAPGRVNLIGDHTDYNDGFVLPAAIDLDTWIAVRRRRDGLVRIASLQAGGSPGSFWADEVAPPDSALPAPDRSWVDYVAGVAWSLREAGLPIGGFDGIVDSSIPPRAGLSSSAALELASALALLGPAQAGESAARLAALAQRAEREYVGVNCGIMDQFAVAAGRAGHAIMLDCRSLESRHVPIPAGLRVVVCDTGSPREPRSSACTERRAECGKAVALLAEQEPSVSSLREVDAAMLRRYRHVLPETVARRAEHVVTENDRVVAAVEALAAGDLEQLGKLFAASHESLRSSYEVSCDALDEMVAVASAVPGVVAARMTGAGFGGCTVNLVREEAVLDLARAVAEEYPRRTGLSPRVYSVAVSDGAGNV